jgi:hypothetical protein
MAYLTNRQAPNSGLANLLAMKGRMGDTELVHMSKPEIDMMRRMGEISTNPKTGLPEAFNLEEEIAGLASLMNMPSAKTAMTDLMEFGKDKLKKLTMKDIEKEMPKQQMPMPMPPMPPQQGAMANLRSGGLVSFGEEIKKAIKENNQDIEPFLNDIEKLVQYRFGVDLSGGPQSTIGTNPVAEVRPAVIDNQDMVARPTLGVLGNPLDYQRNKDGILQSMPMKEKFNVALSEGRRPKDYFEGQVYDDRGDGMTDSIDFKVEGDPVIKGAKLSADEYVLPADLVAMLGNGSSDAGAEKLDDFTKKMRMKAFGTTKQQKKLNATKELKEMV